MKQRTRMLVNTVEYGEGRRKDRREFEEFGTRIWRLLRALIICIISRGGLNLGSQTEDDELMNWLTTIGV